MGNLATPETLALRWAEVMRDPSLQNLPYKIELNARGKIEMSPASIPITRQPTTFTRAVAYGTTCPNRRWTAMFVP